jgi:hypothetical protein
LNVTGNWLDYGGKGAAELSICLDKCSQRVSAIHDQETDLLIPS